MIIQCLLFLCCECMSVCVCSLQQGGKRTRWKGRKWASETLDRDGERGSSDKEMKLPLLLWEGSAEVQWDYGRGRFSLHFLRSHPFSTSLLLCLFFHSLLFLLLHSSRFMPLFSTPLAVFIVRLHPSPSFFQSPPLFSVREPEREVIVNRLREREGGKCSCSSSALGASRCCCWLDVIWWDSIGENRSWLVEKLHSKHLYLSVSVPVGIHCFSRHIPASYFSFWEFCTWNKLHTLQQINPLSLTSHCSMSIQKVWMWKVGRCWRHGIGVFVSKNTNESHVETNGDTFEHWLYLFSAFLFLTFSHTGCRLVEIHSVGLSSGGKQLTGCHDTWSRNSVSPRSILMTFQATSAANRSNLHLYSYQKDHRQTLELVVDSFCFVECCFNPANNNSF